MEKKRICPLLPQRPCFWYIYAIMALIVIVVINVKCLGCPCGENPIEASIFDAIKGVVFSLVAAAIFQWIVVYIPFKKRKNMMTPLINRHIGKIKESLRQCKEITTLYSLDSNDKQQSREDFVREFSECDLTANYFVKGHSKLERIYTLKNEIEHSVDILLSNKEYLTDEQFNFVNKVAISNFIQNDLIANHEECNPDNKNQDIMGESIYDLYESSLSL